MAGPEPDRPEPDPLEPEFGWGRGLLLPFGGGALLLSLLSIPQKLALGAAPLAPEGFVVPILFGGLCGAALAYATFRYRREYYQRFRASLEAERERHRLEALLLQKQKLEAIGRLAGGIAHDFNNVLAVILGMSSLMIRRLGPDDPHLADLEEIHRAGELGASLTRQLLTLEPTERACPDRLLPQEVVQDALQFLDRATGQAVELQTKLPRDTWPILAEKTQFEQVLLNLVLNGRDALGGAGRVVIELANVEPEPRTSCAICSEFLSGPYVRLSVSDEGMGMDDETQARIFEPFFTTKELGRGTGLGLATVLGAVQQNNGHLRVKSAPGEGTTVEAFFRRAELPTSTSTPEPALA